MKVFISWSGGLSEAVAQSIREWLPAVVQSADVWMSSKDLRSGTRWATDIGRELEETEFGIICLTRRNTSSEWMPLRGGGAREEHPNGARGAAVH
jgi:hypothetical protein